MPSPLAHGAAAYVIFRVFESQFTENVTLTKNSLARVVVYVAVLSLLPDLDVIPGLLLGNLEGIHNGVTNSFVVGLLVAAAVAAIARSFGSRRYRLWFVVALISYELHVFMDYLTAERGVMAFWPFSSQRFAAPIKLFYGVHYSDGLFSIEHIWTFLTELAFLVIVVVTVYLVTKLIASVRGSVTTKYEL